MNEQPPAQLPNKLVVFYDFAKNGEVQRHRIFLNGIRNIHTQAEYEACEKLVKETIKADAVVIVDWKQLEG